MIVDDETKNEMIYMFKNGLKPVVIAEESGYPIGIVIDTLRAEGLDADYPRGILDSWDDAKIEVFLKDYYADMPMDELRVKYDFSQIGVVYTILRKLNRTPRTFLKERIEGRKAAYDHAMEMYKQGFPIWKIVQETGLHQSEIHREMHKREIPLRQPRIEALDPTRKALREQKITYALDLYQNEPSLTLVEICQMAGISQPTLHKELKLRNIPLRRPRVGSDWDG